MFPIIKNRYLKKKLKDEKLPIPIISGGTPATAYAQNFACIFRPNFFAMLRFINKESAAPSVT